MADKLQGEARFELKRQLADTLQGRIYSAIDKTDGKWVVVKETWKQLVKLGKSRDNHTVPENFEEEKRIMKYLSSFKDAHPGFVKLLDEWDDENCYNYAMEMCRGGELFEYIKGLHADNALSTWTRRQAQLPQKPMVEANQWIKEVQHMFYQVASCTAWMHSKGVCHLDMSLENAMIGTRSKKRGVEIKIIDFGVAQLYPNQKFVANTPVGKTGYMAPEVFNRKTYDPRAADIWSIGVMLFMMLIGAPPYQVPKRSNPAFNFIVKGRLGDVLKHWKRLGCITEDALDLLNRIFKFEPERIKMEQLLAHPFLKEQAASDKANASGMAKVNKANVEEKGDAMDKEPENKAPKQVAATTEATSEKEPEAGQLATSKQQQHAPLQSKSLSVELGDAFKTDVAKSYAVRLESVPSAEELASILIAVEQSIKGIEEKMRNDESKEDQEGQQKVEELRRIHKAVEQRLPEESESKKAVEPRHSPH